VQIQFEGPAGFNRWLDTETKVYGDIIRAANIKIGR
jgi:hypothetical protein